MINSIEEMDNYFNSFSPNFGKGNLRENRLERMELLLDKLKRPEESFDQYHIAGSKGKGTTASYLATLIKMKYGHCGLYMSPHVYDIRERFTDATEFFSKKDYIDTINELDSAIKSFTLPQALGPERPTTFELYTAYSYLLFRAKGIKHAVIETGLGGRLDATNTLKHPKAAIFTLIELEHTNVLGHTFEEIANEKLGIVQKGCSVYYYQEKLKNEIDKRGIKALHVDTSYKAIEQKNDSVCVTTNDDKHILLANPTATSILDALYAYEIAKDQKELIETSVYDLRQVNLPARFEQVKLKNNRTAIFEGAHTFASTTSALVSFEELLKKEGKNTRENATLIFSLADGKDLESIAKAIIPEFKHIVITGLGPFKRSEPEEIYQVSRKYTERDVDITLSTDAIEATKKAISETGKDDFIFILGSFYLADEIKRALKELGYVD